MTYRDLGGAAAETVSMLVADALEHYRGDLTIDRVEWKTRGHDRAAGLPEALVKNGFEPDQPESIMIGEVQALAVDVPLPSGVRLRCVREEADVRAMSAMQDAVFGDAGFGDAGFGDPVSDATAEALLRRLARDDGMELWVAEAGGQIVSAGRLEPVTGTAFVGIWGGATREKWRGLCETSTVYSPLR